MSNARKLSKVGRGRGIEPFKSDVQRALEEDNFGIGTLENSIRNRVRELRSFIEEDPFWSNIVDMDDLTRVTFNEFSKEKYSRLSIKWTDLKRKTTFMAVAKGFVKNLGDFEAMIGSDPLRNDLIARMMDLLSNQGVHLKTIRKRMSPFPLVRLSTETLFGERGKLEVTQKLQPYDNRRLTLMCKLLEDEEIMKNWKSLDVDVEDTVKQWNEFLSDISYAYYSPKVSSSDNDLLSKEKIGFELIDLISDKQLLDLLETEDDLELMEERDAWDVETIPLEQQIEQTRTKQKRDLIVRNIDSIKDLKEKLAQSFADESKKVTKIASDSKEILDQAVQPLLDCDEFMRNEHLLDFESHGFKFEIRRTPVYKVINSSLTLHMFPNIERKANLLIELNEDSSDYTLDEINHNLRERNVVRGGTNLTEFEPKKPPTHDVIGTVRSRRKIRKNEPFNPFAANAYQVRRGNVEGKRVIRKSSQFSISTKSEAITKCKEAITEAEWWGEFLEFILANEEVFERLVTAIRRRDFSSSYRKILQGSKFEEGYSTIYYSAKRIRN